MHRINYYTMSRLLNLTPHDIHVFDAKGRTTTIPAFSKGDGARMKTEEQQYRGLIAKTDTFDGIPVYTAQIFTKVQWPEGFDAKLAQSVIVSMPVGQYLAKEADAGRHPGFAVYGPNTGPDPTYGAVRENGQIIGTRSFELYVAFKV